MKLIILILLFAISTHFDSVDAGAADIVNAALSQLNVPYVLGGGGYRGKSKGGFDCSGLAQYAVYRGTNKIISRYARQQYNDRQCVRIPFESSVAGDLIFYGSGSRAEHVAIITGPNTLVHSPYPGSHVREDYIWSYSLKPFVQRCF